MNKNLIEVKNLTFKRGERVIYDNLNLKVQQGKITAIMGPSGIGKTTLLKLIGGQLHPEQGEILFDGQDICRLSNRELYEVRKRMGCYSNQVHYLRIFQRLITWHFLFASIRVCQKV